MKLLSKLAGFFGISLSALAWVGVALAIVATGALVHTFDAAIYRAEIAKREQAAATTLASETGRTLAAERAARAAALSRDEAYEKLAQAREQASREGARLSADLRRALDRLRGLSARDGGAAVPAAGSPADSCAHLRTALDRATRALELYESEGDQAAGDGQHGVDVATIAAAHARAEAGGKP
ncbi:MAG: hypothetical protein AB7D00_12840 [Rhodospirillaceae bacterium]